MLFRNQLYSWLNILVSFRSEFLTHLPVGKKSIDKKNNLRLNILVEWEKSHLISSSLLRPQSYVKGRYKCSKNVGWLIEQTVRRSASLFMKLSATVRETANRNDKKLIFKSFSSQNKRTLDKVFALLRH